MMSACISGYLRWVEVLILLAVISILIMLVHPLYVEYARKSARAEVQKALLDWANRQQEWRAEHISYNEGIRPVNTNRYSFNMSDVTSSSFTLTATAQGSQLGDEESGISCKTMSVDQSGSVRTPAACWSL